MSTPDITTVLEDLRRRLADAPHEDDTGAPNEQHRRWQHRQTLRGHINVLTLARDTLGEVEPQIAFLSPQHAFLVTTRQAFVDELAIIYPASDDDQAPPKRMTPRAWALQASIDRIDRGYNPNEANSANLPIDLKMREAGYTAPADQPWNLWAAMYGALPAIEQRLRDLEKRRDDAQAQFDSVLGEVQTTATV